MRIAPENSINRRLTLTMVATTAVALFAACAAFVLYDVVSLRHAMLRDTATLAEVIGINSAVALSFRDRRAAEETLSALTGAERVVGAAIYAEDGEVFAMYDAFRELGQPFSPPVAAEAEQRFEAGALHLFRPIVVDAEAIGTIYLRIETAELRTRVQRYAGIVVGLLVAVVGLGFFISSRLRRQITLPLSQLAEVPEGVVGGEHGAVLPVDGSANHALGAGERAQRLLDGPAVVEGERHRAVDPDHLRQGRGVPKHRPAQAHHVVDHEGGAGGEQGQRRGADHGEGESALDRGLAGLLHLAA